MFRKILFLLLLSSTVVTAQRIGPEYDCYDIKINNIASGQDFIKQEDLYTVCRNQTVSISPDVFAPLRKSDTYQVSPIPYEPYPTTGTDILVTTDDTRSDEDIDLPFKFCFYGQVWDKISVSSNGWLSFTDGVRFKENYPARGNDPQETLPSTDPALLNSILFQKHTHWNSTRSGALRYAVYGEAPCRVFVVSWVDMLAYQLTPAYCTFVLPQSHQIVLHETTNFIDIIAIRHNACPSNRVPEGNSVMGINNSTGTSGLTPPNRNLGIWDAVQEAWRFSPAGELMYRVEWAIDGEKVKVGEDPLTLVVDSKKDITVCLIPETCEADQEYPECYKITIRPAIEIDKVDLEYIVCDVNQDTYDLNIITQKIKDEQSATEEELEQAQLKFLYYQTEDDAMNKDNEIKDIKNYPIRGEVNKITENPVFVRIEVGGLNDCFEILPAMIIKAPVDVAFKENVNLCERYTFPVLTNEEFYYRLERLDEDAKNVVETLPTPSENQLLEKVGYYRVYVKRTNEYDCENVKSYILFVESCSFPKGISPNGDGVNDYLDLTYNNVSELKIYNRYGKLVYEHGKGYKRQWSGQDSSGKQLPTGTYFMYVKTKDSEYQDWIQLMYEVKK